MKSVILGFLMLAAAAGSTAGAETLANLLQKRAAAHYAVQVSCAELHRAAPTESMPAGCYDTLIFSMMLAGGPTVETTILKECLTKVVAKQPQGQPIDILADNLTDACGSDLLAVTLIPQRIGVGEDEAREFVFSNYFAPAMVPAHPR
jgi:hypothetical protein